MKKYYRLLNIGEQIKEGDETLFALNESWIGVPKTVKISFVGDTHHPIRSEIDVKFVMEYIAERIVK